MKTPLCSLFLLCLTLNSLLTSLGAQSTWQTRPSGTTTSAYGYWEFLPSAYHANPQNNYPVLVFFHGNGKFGDGSDTDLQKLLTLGQPKIINNSSHALHNIFEDRSVIVLAPQKSTQWGSVSLRSFLDYALEAYRIDPRRIYLVGNSGGAAGIHAFMNQDEHAVNAATAVLPTSNAANVNNALGGANGALIPYWCATSYGDPVGGLGSASISVNTIVEGITGSPQADVRANYPGNQGDADYNASYDPVLGWVWESGWIPSDPDRSPRMTIYAGSSHGNGEKTYARVEFYDWLFAQQKPDLTITSPTLPSTVSGEGQPITFSATATDMGGQPIAGSQISWSSSIDGDLGSGNAITISNLSGGVHQIYCLAVDDKNRGREVAIQVTVPVVTPFTARCDFGGNSLTTGAVGWNNMTAYNGGVIDDLVDSAGANTGVQLSIESRFDYFTSSGVVASDLYPSEAQQDSMYINATAAELLVTGLNPAQTFDFTFFASRTASDYRGTIYSIGGSSVVLDAANNTNQTVSLLDVTPNASGEVLIRVERDTGSTYGYLGVLTISTEGLQTSADSDADFLPDDWETTHFGGLGEPAEGDYDGDGLSNLIEYALSGNPADAEDGSRPAVSMTTQGNEGYLTLSYLRNRDAQASLLIEVEYSTDLLSWSTVGVQEVSVVPASVPNTDTVTVRCTTAAGAQEQFLRLKVRNP